MILQVVTDPERRGAQVFAIDLERALKDLGETVKTVALGPARHGEGLPIEVLGPSRTGPKTVRNLLTIARGADVIVGHGSTTLYVGAMAAKVTRRPFVYRQISDSLYWANSPTRRFRVRRSLAAADAVVALWQGAADTLVADLGVKPNRIAIIANGVPADRLAVSASGRAQAEGLREGLADSAIVAAYVGALSPEKGLSSAIEALPDEVDRLLVAGDGPDRSILAALAERVAPGRVRFLSNIDDVSVLYEAADFLVFPSLGGDSMPAVLIEAGLASLPVVATETAAVPTMVQHKETGVLVAPGDVVAMRAAMAEMGTESVRRQRMGEAANRWCRRTYEIEVVASEWNTLLKAIVSA